MSYSFKITPEDFSVAQTLECGQCFRFTKLDDGKYEYIARDKRLVLEQGNDFVAIEGIDENEFCSVFSTHFSLVDGYDQIKQELSKDPILATAIKYGSGIRVMKQPFWETLCSFIISQNNNIPRIKGIIGRLCESFGEQNGELCTFPSAEKLADFEPEDLAALRCGFRARYIIDAAKKVARGEVSEQEISTMNLVQARKSLMTIVGVGPKVADCVLLFGADRPDAFPIDIWMKKAMSALFPQGLPECALPYAGIAQQYIFHFVRNTEVGRSLVK